MEDRFNANHPGTARAPVYDDERHPDDIASDDAEIDALKAKWDELKNELTALMNRRCGQFPVLKLKWAQERMLACIEDANDNVLQMLAEAP